MSKPNTSKRLPAIIIGTAEHHRLSGLATAALDHSPEVAEELLDELERARVVAPGRVPASTVRMGSTVTYTADGGTRTVTLVYPAEADIANGRVSIMTPIGAALIGLSEGQSIPWTARDGRRNALTVLKVEPPQG
ncbi:nucleoside diphosphate kinase regulator [Xanthobacter sp. V4C-4]|uniref:nucleoside diphosphate kinase regulator n=1 Tax=Xanthobacter cornucopiae TaxID=3119924 RepID=UPI00372BBD86